MRIFNFLIATACLVAVLFSSCTSDKDATITVSLAKGALIINEGSFGHANGSLSFYYSAKDSMANDVYAKVNGVTPPLGDVVQSAFIQDTLCFVVADNSKKITVVNLRNFKKVTEVADLVLPRYCVVANNKLWVSCWSDPYKAGYISVRNLTTYAEEKKITVGAGPEQLLVQNSKLYVANCGGYTTDSTVSVIDMPTQTVASTIKMGVDNPTEFAVDANNSIWVLCVGSTDWATNVSKPSKINKLNAAASAVETSVLISATAHPSSLKISSDKHSLLVGGGYGFTGIFKMDITATAFPALPFINKSFYGFNTNPVNDEIYACESPSFSSNGNLIRYKADGTLIKSYPVGIGPNGVLFVN